MYLWNTKALAKELKEGTLSEREKFKYYIVGVILFNIMTMFPSSGGSSLTDYLIGIVISSLILFVGAYVCYGVNKAGDNINFIERFICLSLPIGIKFFLLTILFSVIAVNAVSLLGFLVGYDDSLSTILLLSFTSIAASSLVFVVLGIWILYYWRIYVHMKWISHNNTDIISS